MHNNMLAPAALALLAASVVLADPVKFEDEAAFLDALETPLFENFDGFASGQIVSALPGVNVASLLGKDRDGIDVSQFVTAEDDLPFDLLNGLQTPSAPNLLSNDLSDPHFATGTIVLNFASPMSALGFYVADGAPRGTFRIELFSGDTEIGVIESDGPKSLPDSFLGVVSDQFFDRAVIGADWRNDSWGIDDLYAQVPSPGAIALVLLAAAVPGRRRREPAV